MNFDHSTCSINLEQKFVPKHLSQKSKKIYSHKYFHGKSCFAALCSEVVFLHIRKNLLGHFSKMDKVKACPKIKNGPTSFFNVFMWDRPIVGYLVRGPLLFMHYFVK
jgi:hypothetical protein